MTLQVLISWECTMAHAIPWDTFFPWIQKDTVKARFVSGISKASIEHEHKLHRTGWIACDPLAVAVAICPELIEEVQVQDDARQICVFVEAVMLGLELQRVRSLCADSDSRTTPYWQCPGLSCRSLLIGAAASWYMSWKRAERVTNAQHGLLKATEIIRALSYAVSCA